MLDVAIIGAGVTGLAAGMYAGRLNMQAAVFGAATGSEKAIGGVITLTEVVENYPGFKRVTGQELAERLREHLLDYNERVQLRQGRVTAVTTDEGRGCFQIKTAQDSYDTRTVIFATGTEWRKLPMEGAARLENRGVHYCALCDGPLYEGGPVAVVGGGDSAAKEALLLTQWAGRVYIITRRDDIAPEPVNGERVRRNERIEVISQTNVGRILGERVVEALELDRPWQGERRLAVAAVFGAIGSTPLSALAKPLGVEVNERQEIVIDHKSCRTNVAGVFAAGDVVDSGFKQAVVGVGQAVVAAHSAYEHISHRRADCWAP